MCWKRSLGKKATNFWNSCFVRGIHFRINPAMSFLPRTHRLPIFLAVSIGFFNQMSGVNAILYYINDIFAQAGFDTVSSNLQAVAVGATNFIFTMLAMSVIDRFGRKRLLLIGAVGTSICLGGVAAIFITHVRQSLLVFFLVGFIGLFSFSQGAVIWVYLSEVFPTDVRAKGTSLGSLTHWLFNAIVSGLYPIVAAGSRGKPFVLFCCMTVIQFFVVLLYYPETKGVSLEEMQAKICTYSQEHSIGGTLHMSIQSQRISRRDFVIQGGTTLGVLATISPYASGRGSNNGAKRRVLHIIGHSHIDAAWLWPWREGADTVLTTFRSALDRMNETPGFCYSHSSSAHYLWTERADPAMYAEIRERIRQNRWEVLGAWPVEPDCNIPSTESFVRHSLYGKEYCQRELGVDVKIGVNPDSFGHAAGLPIVLKRAGYDYYVFMRPQPQR